MKNTDKIEDIENTSAIYKLLSRAFIREVDVQFLRQLRTADFYESLKQAGVDFGDEFLKQDEDSLLEDLAVEYARLFIVPGEGISPYESVYLEQRFYGEAAGQVKEFYHQCGLTVGSESMMPDHIGLELELMGHLKRNEAEAIKNDNIGNSKWVDLFQQFATDERCKWMTQFFTDVEKTAEHAFYKGMAMLGKGMMSENSNNSAI